MILLPALLQLCVVVGIFLLWSDRHERRTRRAIRSGEVLTTEVASRAATRTAQRLGHLALAWALLAGVALLFIPLGTSSSSSDSGSSMAPGTAGSEAMAVPTVTTTHYSLLQGEGPGVVLVLLLPAAILAPAVMRRRPSRAGLLSAAAVMNLCCLLGAASIGMFFMPAAILVLIAGFFAPSALDRNRFKSPSTPCGGADGAIGSTSPGPMAR